MRSAQLDVLIGDGPLALALARQLATEGGQVVLASPTPRATPGLWRHAHPLTGEGVRAAVQGARRVWLVLDDAAAHGAAVVLRHHGGPVTVLHPLDRSLPPGCCDHWSTLALGPCWGPEEPIIARWSSIVGAGRHLWLPDPGEMHPVPMADAVTVARAAMERPGARWVLPGQEPARLPDLATELGRLHGRPVRSTRVPLALAMRREGLDPTRVRRWLETPGGNAKMGDWKLPRSAGRAAWVTPTGHVRVVAEADPRR